MLDLDALQPETIRPLRRSEYERLVEAGAFEDERVELLRGVIVTMSPQSNTHGWVVSELTRLLNTRLGMDTMVRPQSSYAADEYSEPEPDVCVVPRQAFGDPLPDRALLVIEVSVSSLKKDRTIKRAIYAENGVPEYWIVDVDGGAVEVHTDPRDGEYQTVARFERSETLRPIELAGVAIAVAEILPQGRTDTSA